MVKLSTRSLVPGMAYVAHLARCRSRETLPVLIVSAAGMYLELVPLEAGLSAVVAFVGIVMLVVVVETAAVVALDSGGTDGPNRSVMTWGTSVESFGLE